MSSEYNPIEITSFTALHDDIIVEDMKFKERFSGAGIFIPSDDSKIQGVHPRWAKVYAVGPEQEDIAVGQYVCVEHGRWTRGVVIRDADGLHTIRKLDTKAVMLVSDEPVVDEILGRPL